MSAMLDVIPARLDTINAHAPALAPADGRTMVCSRVYLGRSIPKFRDERNRFVRDEGVNRFIQNVVAPLFPNGFTVHHATGGWYEMASGRTITEPSIVIEVVHYPDQNEDVETIAAVWKRWFDQEAAMITQTPVMTRFV